MRPRALAALALLASACASSAPAPEASTAGDEAPPPAEPPTRFEVCLGDGGRAKEGGEEAPPTCVDEARRAHAEGDYPTALLCFRMLFQLMPRPELLFDVGILRRDMGETDRARACFELAIEHGGSSEAASQRSQDELTRLGG